MTGMRSISCLLCPSCSLWTFPLYLLKHVHEVTFVLPAYFMSLHLSCAYSSVNHENSLPFRLYFVLYPVLCSSRGFLCHLQTKGLLAHQQPYLVYEVPPDPGIMTSMCSLPLFFFEFPISIVALPSTGLSTCTCTSQHFLSSPRKACDFDIVTPRSFSVGFLQGSAIVVLLAWYGS